MIRTISLVNVLVEGGEILVWKVVNEGKIFYYKFSERKGYCPFLNVSLMKETIDSKDDILLEKNGFNIPKEWYIKL
jgi:hypothetical protein